MIDLRAAKPIADKFARMLIARAGSGQQQQIVDEYEIDGSAVEALNSIERQVAIETGQWSEKQDFSVNAKVHQQAVSLAEVFSLEELLHGDDLLLKRDGRARSKTGSTL